MIREKRYEAALRNAFARRNEITAARSSVTSEWNKLQAVAYGEANGWVTSEIVEAEPDCLSIRATLTALGRHHFGLKKENRDAESHNV